MYNTIQFSAMSKEIRKPLFISIYLKRTRFKIISSYKFVPFLHIERLVLL
jgi:hypothetical protein